MEELLSGNPHIEKESARSIADGAMMEAASVCVGQMVRPGAPSPPSSLRPPSPARSESVLEGPARHSSWAWRRAPLRDLAAFLSHQKTQSEVPALGGRARQGRLGLGGRRPYWVASLGPR